MQEFFGDRRNSCSSFVPMTPGLDETRMKMLGELAEMTLVLARDLQQAALTAETTDEKVRLADAFHKVGRGVRQSLALHAKLERDAQAAEREAAAQAAPAAAADQARRQRRAAGLESAIERLIWTEREKLEEEPSVLRIRLGSLVADESRAEGFLETDPELQIDRLCEALRLPRPSRRRQAGPAGPDASPAHRREPGDDGGGSFSSA
jgi:hypothetical protein